MSLATDDLQRALAVLDAQQPVQIRQYRPDLADDAAFLSWASQPLLAGFQIESDAQGVDDFDQRGEGSSCWRGSAFSSVIAVRGGPTHRSNYT